MSCDKCGSERIALISAHSRDCSSFILPFDNIEVEADYFPYVKGVCSGDDATFDLCMDCGKVQGEFPKTVDLD